MEPSSESWKVTVGREIARQCPALVVLVVLVWVFVQSSARQSEASIATQQQLTAAVMDLRVALLSIDPCHCE